MDKSGAPLSSLMRPEQLAQMEKLTRLENAVRAVTMGYQYCRDFAYVPEVITKDADGKAVYTEATMEIKAAEFVRAARLLIPQIEADLNATLTRLD